MAERGNWCASSGFLDSRNACRNPDGCVCDIIIYLRARLETVEAETRERCAQIVEPKRPRPCTCERCECDKPEDAEDVGRWDGAYAAAAAIRNLEPRHD